MVEILFFRFRVTNSRLKNKKFHVKLRTRWVSFYFLTFELRTEVDKWKKNLNISLNVREPLEINTAP